MDEKKLEKAINLRKEIEELQRHKKELTHLGSSDIDLSRSRLQLFPYQADSHRDARTLKKHILPISCDPFIKMYLSNLDAEIAKLQQEFEDL